MASYYAGILGRIQMELGAPSNIHYTATMLEGDPNDVIISVYREYIKNAAGPWFSGDGAFYRAQILAHMLCDDAKENFVKDVTVIDLYDIVCRKESK